jgi:hypothetical protein
VVKPDKLPEQRNVLPGNADVAAVDAALLDEPCDDPAGGVARNGKTDALGRPDDGGIDPDDLALRIDQRASGVAGIERRVGVWMTLSISRPEAPRKERPSPLTMPAVTVCWNPIGEPMAMAI